jgi:hypothetical protein
MACTLQMRPDPVELRLSGGSLNCAQGLKKLRKAHVAIAAQAIVKTSIYSCKPHLPQLIDP